MIKLLSKLVEYKNSNPEKLNKSIPDDVDSACLTTSLVENISVLKGRFQGSVDIVFREFNIGGYSKTSALIVYIEGLIERATLNDTILQPLMSDLSSRLTQDSKQGNLIDLIKNDILPNSKVQKYFQIKDVINGILTGETALLLDGNDQALVIETKGGEGRDVKEPDTEAVVRGPREGFTESIRVNIALTRRKIRNENLRIEALSLGTKTKTSIYVAYLQGVVNEKLVGEVKARLQRIDIDGILESGYVEQLIEDAPSSIFPTIGNSEKPDVLAGKLLEGRVGILVDGTPFVLTIPRLYFEAFQSAEDYYSRPYYVTLVRWIRMLSFFITILLPGVYVSLQSFQPEMIPTGLLLTMAGAREGVPFPAYFEVLIMGGIFEIMREAGIRMPRPIGQAVSIVGALVLGEAAVRAGIITNPMVIVVSLTAISGFVISSLGDTLPLLRLFFTICGAVLGLFGVLMGGFVVFIHMAKLRSFGIPYLSPMAPGNIEGLKDILIKAPAWALKRRPTLLSGNAIRNRTPKPSKKRNELK